MKYYLLIPILLAILLNPFVVFEAYIQTIPLERPEHATITVNGVVSDQVKTGDYVTANIFYTLVEPTKFKIEAMPDSLLQIDGIPVTTNETNLQPGQHSFFYELKAQGVDYPEKKVFLSVQPLTNVDRVKGFALAFIVYPWNWYALHLMLILSGIAVAFVSVVNITIILLIERRSAKTLEQKIEALQQRLDRTKSKVVSMVELLSKVAEETGYSEDSLMAELQKQALNLPVEEEAHEEEATEIPEKPSVKEGIVKITLPLRKLFQHETGGIETEE